MQFTQNPIGSDSQLDLSDNAIAFDYAMNSPAALWSDRFGKQHKTVQQALKDVGFKPAGFDFVTGGTLGIGDRDKCVFYPTDGYWYNWNGKLPYVVTNNSSPIPGGKKGWGVVSRDNLIVGREALRRTLAETGLTLVAGSFEAGGLLSSANEVLLQENTGKVYSWNGSFPKVITSSTGTEGFTCKNDDLVYRFKTISAMKSSAIPPSVIDVADIRAITENYYHDIQGGGSDYIITTLARARIIKANQEFTPDGWGDHYLFGGTTYVALLAQKETVSARSYGLRGDYVTDDKPALAAMWDSVVWGSKIEYGVGCFKIVGGHTHPLKQLIHQGAFKAPTFVPSATNIKGTSFYFPIKTGINKGGIYMPPPEDGKFSRYSLFENITFFGDGTNDNNGTVTTLKINNLGTSLKNVEFRYGDVGIEANYMVGSNWTDVFAFGRTHGILFIYDHTTPFGVEIISVVTQCGFKNIGCATSETNTSAAGLMVDATCNFGGNTFTCLDLESCYVGAIIEGRVQSKDYLGVLAHGAAAWKSSGSTIDTLWFERNTSDNIRLIFDRGNPPAITVTNMFQDSYKVFASSKCELVLQTKNGLSVLAATTEKDAAQGYIGQYGSPFTAKQYLLHGPEVNTPMLRTIVREVIPTSKTNRLSIDTKSSFEFDSVIDSIPLIGATFDICHIDFKTTFKTALVELAMVGMGVTGTPYVTKVALIVTNLNDQLQIDVLDKKTNGVEKLFVSPLRVATNLCGLYVYKDATLSETPVRVTVSCKVTLSGSNVGTFDCALIPRLK